MTLQNNVLYTYVTPTYTYMYAMYILCTILYFYTSYVLLHLYIRFIHLKNKVIQFTLYNYLILKSIIYFILNEEKKTIKKKTSNKMA